MMNNVNATTANVTPAEVFENELWERLCRQNDEDLIFSDLTGLYVDIIGVISKADKANAGIIYDYAKLLEQEIQLYSGAEAYIAGQKAKGKPLCEVLNAYMLNISGIKHGQRLDNRIQESFDRIGGLLADKDSLITDFTEAYFRVHSVVKNNIHEFIRLGQTYGEETAG